MSCLKFVVLLCLVAVAVAGGHFENCEPGSDDTLLDDVRSINLVVGGHKLNKKYSGYKLTCVRCTKGLLDVLGDLLNLSVLEGGKHCDRVLLQLNIGHIGARCRVYGQKLKEGESPKC